MLSFGDATYFGRVYIPCSRCTTGTADDVVGTASSPNGAVYWVVDHSGQVRPFATQRLSDLSPTLRD